MSIELEFRDDLLFGMGVNYLTGETRGSGVTPGASELVSDAQNTHFNVEIVEDTDSLYKTLAVTAKMQGQYGLGSAKGKVSFCESSNFNSHSTFVVARAVVENPWEVCNHATLEEPAKQLIKDGELETFLDRYGNGYVQSRRTGGEFCAVIEITSDTKENQRSLAAKLKGSYGGIASGSVSYSEFEKSTSSHSRTKVITYQSGGKGESAAFTGGDMDLVMQRVMQRLVDFPKIVSEHPMLYSARVADYSTLDHWPKGPSHIDTLIQEEGLERYARIRRDLLVKIKDVEFIQSHLDFFVNPPSPAKLNDWSRFFSDQLAQLEARMRRCVRSHQECTPFPVQVPDDYLPPERVARLSKFVGKWQRENFPIVLQLTVNGEDVSGVGIQGGGEFSYEYHGKIRNDDENVADMVCLAAPQNSVELLTFRSVM